MAHTGWRALSGGGDDKTARLWDLGTGKTTRTLKGHTSAVMSVALSADGTRALSGSWDKTVRLWDLTLHLVPYLTPCTLLPYLTVPYLTSPA